MNATKQDLKNLWRDTRTTLLLILLIVLFLLMLVDVSAQAYYRESSAPLSLSRDGFNILVSNGDQNLTITLVEYPSSNFVVNFSGGRNEKKMDITFLNVQDGAGSVVFSITTPNLREACHWDRHHAYDETGNFTLQRFYVCQPIVELGDLGVDFRDYTRRYSYDWRRSQDNILLRINYTRADLVRNGTRFNLVIDPSFFASQTCFIEGDNNSIDTIMNSTCANLNRITCNAARTVCSSNPSLFVGGNLTFINMSWQINATSNGARFIDGNKTGNFTLKNSTVRGGAFRVKFRVDGGRFTCLNCTILNFGYAVADDWTAAVEFRNATINMDGFFIGDIPSSGGDGVDGFIIYGRNSSIRIQGGRIESGRYGIRMFDESSIIGSISEANNSVIGNLTIHNKTYSIGGEGGINTLFENITVNYSREIGAYFFGTYDSVDRRSIENLQIKNFFMNDSPYCDVDFGMFFGHNVVNSTIRDSTVAGICGQSIATRDNYGIDFYSANGSRIVNVTVRQIGNFSGTDNFAIAVKTDSGTVPQNITIENNTVEDIGRGSLTDSNYGIYVLTGRNVSITKNYVSRVGHTSADTGYGLYLEISNGSVVSYNNIDNIFQYGSIADADDSFFLYNNYTTTRSECALMNFDNVMSINNTYADCSNGGIAVAIGGFTLADGRNNTFIQDKFLSVPASIGYSFYSISNDASPETRCYNCTFEDSIYIEDANPFRVLEFWQAYVNTTGDVPLSSANASCYNTTGGGFQWSQNTKTTGYTDTFNRTRLYYAGFAFDTPTETWGDITCNATKTGYSTSSLNVLWTHSYLVRDFWLNLTLTPVSSLFVPAPIIEESENIKVSLIPYFAGGVILAGGAIVFILRKRKGY